MTKKKTLIIGLTASIFLLGATGLAVARPGGGGFFGHRMGRLIQQLDLTEEQQDLALELRSEMRSKRKAMRSQMLETMQTVASELEKPQPDSARLHQVANDRLEVMRTQMHQHIDNLLKLHSTLSDEQRTKLVRQLQRARKYGKHMLED